MNIDNLVIGAGISGISAAWQLHSANKNYIICDATATPGGCIATNKKGEFLWEEGPSSFLPKPEILKLIADAKLTGDIIMANRKLPRFIYHDSKLKTVPTSPVQLITSDLLSTKAKLRLFSGLLGFIKPAPTYEESVSAFFTRHLGSEPTQRLVEPFVSGVYAGNINKLTSQSVFSKISDIAGRGKIIPGIIPGLIKNKIKNKKNKPAPLNPNMPKIKKGMLCNLKNGLDSLPKALIKNMGNNVRYNWTAKSITKSDNGFEVVFDTLDGLHTVICKNLILALPAYAAADILQPLGFNALNQLRDIQYPSLATVITSWDQIAAKNAPIGFGFLTPRSEGIRTLGSVFTSSLFEKRSPGGHRLFTSFIGGATDANLAKLNIDQISKQVKNDIAKCTGIKSDDGTIISSRLWTKAIPQYNMGHQAQIRAIKTAQRPFKGLYLIGNYFEGVSLGDCINNAVKTIKPIADS